MVVSAKHLADEAVYSAQRKARYAGGMLGRLGLKMLVGLGAAFVGVSGGAGAFFLTGLIGIGSGVGLKAYLNDKDREHKKEQMAKMYSEELGKYLGKPPQSVTVEDLEHVGQKLPSIQKQTERDKLARNVKTGVWLATAVVAFAATGLLSGVFFGAAASNALAYGLASAYASFQFVKPLIIEPLAEKKYGLDQRSTAELVQALEWRRTKGSHLDKTQVMEVFVSAHPQLAAAVKQEYGANYHSLSHEDRTRAANKLGQSYDVEYLTQTINMNKMNARELTFAVHGEESGAAPDASYKQQLRETASNVKQRARNIKKNVQVAGQNAISNIHMAGQNAISNVRSLVGYEGGSHQPDTAIPTEAAAGTDTKWRDYENNRRAQAAQKSTQIDM